METVVSVIFFGFFFQCFPVFFGEFPKILSRNSFLGISYDFCPEIVYWEFPKIFVQKLLAAERREGMGKL